MKIRFLEAEANYTRLTGEKFNREMYEKLFPDCSETTRRDQISKLRTGKRKTHTIEMIQIICESCFVDPNFLYGFKLNN